MKWLIRPSSLLVMLGMMVGVAAAWVYFGTLPPPRPTAVPVSPGEQEIAWLAPATSASSWRRFVQGFQHIPGARADENTFPDQTTVVPELRVRLSGQRGQLVFRWYKLTSELSTEHWVTELLKRDPPPLAIIGGSNSQSAKQLAMVLNDKAKSLPRKKQPLLLLTTATASTVPADNEPTAQNVELIRIYPRRTFRVSFTNEQMCAAVLDFLWKKTRLRPSSLPAYTAYWEDDPYSVDLLTHFLARLGKRGEAVRARAVAALIGAQVSNQVVGGAPWDALREIQGREIHAQPFEQPFRIPWSEGSYDRPNHFEAQAATFVLDQLEQRPWQSRALLFLPAGTKPARRFLRAMYRLSPTQTRRFVVATGDAISLNAVYRDRIIAWPIQDMPCSLVFFTHHNPVDVNAGFGARPKDKKRGEPSSGGTNDLLLYQTIAQAMYLSTNSEEGAVRDARDLTERFRTLRWLREEGVTIKTTGDLLFDQKGDRRSGTGEHIIWLEPHFRGERVLPMATIHVYAKEPSGQWTRYKRSQLEKVSYTGDIQGRENE